MAADNPNPDERSRPAMTEPERTRDDEATSTAATAGDVGDFETAGETTAAAAIHGPDDNTPVGADTLAKLKVTGSPDAAEDETD
jgi:hypothetical protein